MTPSDQIPEGGERKRSIGRKERNQRLARIASSIDRQIDATKHYLVQNGIDANFADVLMSHYTDLAEEVRGLQELS